MNYQQSSLIIKVCNHENIRKTWYQGKLHVSCGDCNAHLHLTHQIAADDLKAYEHIYPESWIKWLKHFLAHPVCQHQPFRPLWFTSDFRIVCHCGSKNFDPTREQILEALENCDACDDLEGLNLTETSSITHFRRSRLVKLLKDLDEASTPTDSAEVTDHLSDRGVRIGKARRCSGWIESQRKQGKNNTVKTYHFYRWEEYKNDRLICTRGKSINPKYLNEVQSLIAQRLTVSEILTFIHSHD